MGDGEPLTVDFDSFSKGMSFYSPEHPQKGFRAPASQQQLDHSKASTDTGEQYSSDLSPAEQMDKLSPQQSLEKNTVTGAGETRSELRNGVHGGKENGSSDAGMESLMTSLGRLALAQSGATNIRRTASWDEQALSLAMYHQLTTQSGTGSGHPDDSVASQQRVGTTSHSAHQLVLGSAPLALHQGSALHNNVEPYQSWNDGNAPVHGSWARQNVHYNGSLVPNQRRAMAYIPSGQQTVDSSAVTPKLRQNSPFPKSLQHLVATNKTNSDFRSCDNTIRSSSYLNFQQVCLYVI